MTFRFFITREDQGSHGLPAREYFPGHENPRSPDKFFSNFLEGVN
jgi:hypothetical protein